MMAEKTRTFHDEETLAEILAASNPSVIKKLGRKVAKFDAPIWHEKCIEGVYTFHMWNAFSGPTSLRIS